jgi:hypothetical protein
MTTMQVIHEVDFDDEFLRILSVQCLKVDQITG